mmetsp:Transcript_77368/g.135225  ORF Transcript_77368/g.135225 Transcript_77368/m.135225 type:complete len:429 (+) Transcript_77368:65-1351(+)
MSAQIWEVVGGADKGGILVREGKDLASPQATRRLSTGARVRELNLLGERLEYELIDGSGPETGWVSLKLKDKVLLEKVALPETPDSQPDMPGSALDMLNKYKGGQLDALVQEYRKILEGMPMGPPIEEPRRDGAGTEWERYVPVAPAEGRPRVLLQGDSLTHGAPYTTSSPLAAAVARRNPSISIENAGYGGSMAMTLLDPADFRIPILKAGEYEADYVCIMIGTNDAMCISAEEQFTDQNFVLPSAWVKDFGGPPRLPKDWRTKCPPSVELYETSLAALARQHREKGLKVALVTPPPLGEDLTDKVDKVHRRSPFTVVSELAAATKRVAAAEGCALLPFFECACHRLAKLKRAPIRWTPSAFNVRLGASIAQRQTEQEKKLSPKIFAEFGHPNGRPDFCHDLVHLNEDGAAILATLIQEWLDSEISK